MKILLYTIAMVLGISAMSQTTLETFESGMKKGDTTFISNGQSFDIGHKWVMDSIQHYGAYGSNWYMDSHVTCQDSGIIGSVKTSDGTDVLFNEVWLYASEDCIDNNTGYVTVHWYNNDIKQHSKTYLVESAILSGGTNGFKKLDLSGEVNMYTPVDEIQFEVIGDLTYLGMDNMSWTKKESIISGNPPLSMSPNSFIVYPNPSNYTIEVISPNSNIKSKLSVLSLQGAELMSSYTQSLISTISIDSLPSGTYVVRAENENATTTVKFIKE